jgi:hypothetical protein
MQKILFFLVIILILSVYACKTGQKNENTKFDLEEVSEEYFFPEELTYSQSVSEVLIDKFYPIGWSKNGNFAYIIEPADEAIGNYMFGIIIVNLVSNDTIWSWFTDPVLDKELYREDIWKKHYKEFHKNLNKNGIQQQRKIKLVDNYFTNDNKDYVVRLETTTEKDKDMGIEIVIGSKIFIKSPDLGDKQISDTQYEYSMILGQQLSGCILSPYEDRIVIILKNERWGYEGPPNVVQFEIFGTNLTTGFNK